MKFTNKIFPILGMFDGPLMAFPAPIDKERISYLKEVIAQLWGVLAPVCSKQVYYLTEKFLLDFSEDIMQLSEINGEMTEQRNALFLNGAFTLISKTYSCCTYADHARGIFCDIQFAHAFNNLLLRSFVFRHPDFPLDEDKFAWTSLLDAPLRLSTPRALDSMAQVLAAHYFFVSMQTSTKIIASPKSRTKVSFHEHHTNETNLPIQIIDERWYTNVVRSAPFYVEGFTRKQPVGPGRKEIKEIIIEGFWKHGYTSKAKKDIPSRINTGMQP